MNKFPLLIVTFLGNLIMLSAQPVTYNFRHEQGLLTPLAEYGSGFTEHTVMDDLVGNHRQKLPFTFKLYGVSMDSVNISENGFIWFGSKQELNIGPISVDEQGVTGVISSLGKDLHPHIKTNLTTTIRSGIVGTAPYRMFIVEWANTSRIDPVKEDQPEDTLTFQIKLYETTNRVELVYGFFKLNKRYISVAEVGIKGESSNEFYNRKTELGKNWDNTVIGDFPESTCELSEVYYPQFGQLLVWEPNGSTGLKVHQIYADAKVFPNPTRDAVQFEFPESINECIQVDVFNLQGMLVKSVKMNASEKLLLQGLPNGFYAMQITTAKGNYLSKVLVQE